MLLLAEKIKKESLKKASYHEDLVATFLVKTDNQLKLSTFAHT